MERVQKLLSRYGYCSRRKAEQLIAEGEVSVNGHTVTELGTKVNPAIDKIKVEGKKLAVYANKIFSYYIINKPAGYIFEGNDFAGNRNDRRNLSGKIPAELTVSKRIDKADKTKHNHRTIARKQSCARKSRFAAGE